ncbi:response regulator [Orrella sp. JC864]|uniref:response regulator n=1 Tax=Orrella sp. JC864 TaxID=3120298 RepID=UPI003009BF2D
MSTSSSSAPVVLAVDDDDLVLDVMLQSLEELGYHPVGAANGGEALGVLEDQTPVALLVTDVRMPGMSGIEVAKAARQRRADLPVLFVTGFSTQFTDANLALDRGMALLRKPYTLEALESAIKQLMDASAARH